MTSARIPFATLALLATNLIASAFAVLQPGIIDVWGFKPNNADFLHAFASLFLHINLLHLLGNMVFLAAVGVAVEFTAGWIKFLSVYLLGGLAGLGLHYLMTVRGGDTSVIVGASGCVASCIGYYSSRFIGTRVSIWPSKTVSVATIALVWVALQVSGVFIHVAEDKTSTAFWAHLGGFCVGLVLSLLVQPVLPTATDDPVEEAPEKMLRRAESALAKNPQDKESLALLAESANRLGDSQKERSAILNILPTLAVEELPQWLNRLGELQGWTGVSIAQKKKMAYDLRTIDSSLSANLWNNIIDDPNAGIQRAEAIYSLVEMIRESDPKTASQLLNRLVKEFDGHETVDWARKKNWLP